MHTDSTLNYMETATKRLGNELRRFQHITCSAFSTVELPKEAATRSRRKGKADAKSSATDARDQNLPASIQDHDSLSPGPSIYDRTSSATTRTDKNKRQTKTLNLSTYKVHSLGDYVPTIRAFGTTDSYSTQTVCYLCSFNYVTSFIRLIGRT